MYQIPELLTTISGEKITNAVDWETFRRKEIIKLYEEYVFGVRDIERPDNLRFEKKSEKLVCDMKKKELTAGFNDFAFPFTLYLPSKAKKPVPVFIYIMHEYQEDTAVSDERGNINCGTSIIPIKDITDRGFGIAIMPTRSIYRDWEKCANFHQGVFEAVHSYNKRKSNSWATISAWAWGASRVLDYLETDGDVDITNIAVIGHSRSGKTALWAAATDSRFKLAVSNNSGCMGAAFLRGKEGEHIKDINMTDWFCENFRLFNEREEMLPVDQHMLLSLIAPRFIYVTSSSEDNWADPKAEFKSCHMANEAYNLYGCMKGIEAPLDGPELEAPYHEGHIAYHMKQGDHSITQYDWDNVMSYFEKIIQL